MRQDRFDVEVVICRQADIQKVIAEFGVHDGLLQVISGLDDSLRAEYVFACSQKSRDFLGQVTRNAPALLFCAALLMFAGGVAVFLEKRSAAYQAMSVRLAKETRAIRDAREELEHAHRAIPQAVWNTRTEKLLRALNLLAEEMETGAVFSKVTYTNEKVLIEALVTDEVRLLLSNSYQVSSVGASAYEGYEDVQFSVATGIVVK